MVTDPSEYIWSSYQVNALAKKSDLCISHPEYLGLGISKDKRIENYRALVTHHVEGELLEEIRSISTKEWL